MRIDWRRAVLLPMCAFLIGQLAAEKPSLSKQRRASVRGRTLAGVDLTGFLRGGLGDRYEVFVFGSESSNQIDSITPIKVMYRFFQSEPALPDSFLDTSKRYELQVIREPNCDETVQSLSYQKNMDATGKPLPSTYILRPLDGSPKDILKPDLVLPCYILHAGNYKVLKQAEERRNEPVTRR